MYLQYVIKDMGATDIEFITMVTYRDYSPDVKWRNMALERVCDILFI